MPNQYSAYAVLLVDRDEGIGGFNALLSSFGVPMDSGSDGSDSVSLILTILESRQFTDRLVEEFDIIEKYEIKDYIKTKSREIIRLKTNYSYHPSSNTLVLSFKSSDPDFAAEFVNREIELLEEWYDEYGGVQNQQELHVLESQLVAQENKIKAIEEDLRKFQSDNNGQSIEELAALQATMIGDLRTQKTQVDLQIQAIRQFAQPGIENENLNNLLLQRDNINRLISQLEQGYSGGEKIMPSVEELPALALEYSRLQQELSIQNTIYSRLREQVELAKLNQEQGMFFSVLEKAEVPEIKTSPDRKMISIAGLFVSFILGAAIALALDYRESFITSIKKRIDNAQKNT